MPGSLTRPKEAVDGHEDCAPILTLSLLAMQLPSPLPFTLAKHEYDGHR